MNQSAFSVFELFQSGMVLQRDKAISIWGTAPKGSTITVQLSKVASSLDCCNANPVSGKIDCQPIQASATADSENKWFVALPPQAGGTNFHLEISDGTDTISLTDIAIGDVWLACGQSNMEFFLRYDKDWEEIKQYEKNPNIRMYNVPQLAFPGHKKNTTGYGTWFKEGEVGFETFSAPGYSFARNIQPSLDVPVGIIGCNWGGTTAVAWLDEELLKKEPLSIYLKEYEEALSQYTPEEMKQISLDAWAFEDSEKHGTDFMPLLYGRSREWQLQYMKDHAGEPVIPLGPYNINRPGGLYHQMLEPLIPFSIKGALWYQGESDAYHADVYNTLLTTLIQSWREKWQDDFAFLIVQLAPFGIWLDCTADRYTEVRTKQELVSKTVPNTGLASIMDIGSYYDIHPKQKMEVGRRLALLAQGKVYGEALLCESPEFVSATRTGNEITLHFSNGTGLHGSLDSTAPIADYDPQSGATTGTIAQSDTVSYEPFRLTCADRPVDISSTKIDGSTIVLTADLSSVAPKEPLTLQFAWADYVEVHVWNEAGLPVKPFCVTI